MKGTNKPKEHTETSLICFNTHRDLSQLEQNKYVWTHSKSSDISYLYIYIQVKKMFKRREECDTDLTNVCRHHHSRKNPVKR